MSNQISTVRVLKNGRPLENARVALGWNGFSNLGSTDYFRTDSNGVAAIPHTATGQCTVYVDGQKFEGFYSPGSKTINL